MDRIDDLEQLKDLGAGQPAPVPVVRLSIEDQRAFADAILNPPEPTPALRRAFRRHHELIKETPSPTVRAAAP